ncbi:MAG: aldo/keto reductase [Rhodospirillales bacterium]
MSDFNQNGPRVSRADFLKILGAGAAGAAVMGSGVGTGHAAMKISTRPIPSTGERIPIVGVGTYKRFNVGESAEERAPIKKVLQVLFEQGSNLIDTAPMYKRSETVVGDLLRELKLTDKAWIATKVRTKGKENGLKSYDMSEKLLGKGSINLMQIHSLVDWEVHYPVIREMKQAGRWKYIGLTHSKDAAHEKFAAAISKEKFEFGQINYSIMERSAAKRILPIAADKGMAMLINEPYNKAAVFKKVKGKALPDWSKEFCSSWGQFFLKYCLSHPAVTAVIPATSKPKHMLDNAGAGFGRMPDAKERKKMEEFWDSL